MSYFLHITYSWWTKQYTYQLSRGASYDTAMILYNISRVGAAKWLKEKKRRCRPDQSAYYTWDQGSKEFGYSYKRIYQFL